MTKILATMLTVTAVACTSPASAPAESQAAVAPAVALPAAPPVMQQGLVTEVLKRGQGKEARSGDTVQVHYVGSFPDGRRFETSRDRGEPFRFQLGAGKVMRGWDEGIQGMKAGEVRKLTIPPSLAYGDSQVGAIPPNSTLVFELELVSVL